jgi:hypothetical protein
MKTGGFPKTTSSALSGEAGVALVTQRFLLDFGWLLRRTHHEHDFGIDGHVDIINESGEVTGRQFAVQIKYGSSYFEGASLTTIPCRGQLKHLNYYLNYPMPVILLLAEPGSTDIFWAHVHPSQTRRVGKSWAINIPRSQKLTTSSRVALEAIVGPSQDHSSALEQYWRENEFLGQFSSVLLGVSRVEVEQNDVSYFGMMFERLGMNDDLARQLEGKVGFFIDGYEDDPRELWEIDEVRRWILAAQPIVKYWFFFLARQRALLLLALCSLPVSRIPGGGWEIDFSSAENWLNTHYIWLNEIADRLGLTEEEIKRISVEVIQYFFPEYKPSE